MVTLAAVRVQRMEVVTLVGRRIQLGVEQTGWKNRIDGVVAVTGGVGSRSHVLV